MLFLLFLQFIVDSYVNRFVLFPLLLLLFFDILDQLSTDLNAYKQDHEELTQKGLNPDITR